MKHMLKLKTTLCALAIAGIMTLVSAAAAQALPDKLSKVTEVQGITEYRLANGLQVLLFPDSTKPTVIVSTSYRVGSRMEGYGETGMAHLLEHLTFKGTKNIVNVGQELSKRGIGFNGQTGPDDTKYFETFPATADTLDWVLGVEAERMTAANIAKSDLDSEMTVVRNEMESGENSPARILAEKMAAAAYQWHSYGKSTIGARSDVENVNIAHLQNFYRKYYQPDNATLVVAGKFDPAHALAVIANDFGSLPKPARVLEPSYTVEPVQEGERTVTLRRPGGEQWVAALYHIVAATSPDAPAFDAIASALGDDPNGRLYKRLIETRKAQENYVTTRLLVDPGYLQIEVKLRPTDNIEEVKKILLDTVEGLAKEPITEEELKRAKLKNKNGFERFFDNPQSFAFGVANAATFGDWRLIFAQYERMQNLQLADVNRVASQWFKPSNRTLGMFVPTDHPDRAPVAEKTDVAAVMKDFKAGKAIAAGEDFIATPENIEARTERVTLPSGLKLMLLPKKTRGETVVVDLQMHFGNEENLRGQRPAGELVGQMLDRGTTRHARKQLSDASDAIQTNLGVQGWISGAKAGLQTKREHLSEALNLLAEILREPSFPADEFAQLKNEIAGSLESSAKEPQLIADVAINRYLHAYAYDDPRYSTSFDEHLKEVNAVKLDDVKRFYQRYWGMDHGEIAVVGDFDAQAVKAQLTTLFGNWKSTMPYQRVPGVLSTAVPKVLIAETPDKQNAIAIGSIPLALRDSDPDFPALRVAGHVWGAGSDSRLNKRIRQKDGLSYGVGGGVSASGFEEADGQLGMGAIYAPQNRAKLEAAFADELQRFVHDGISADELASAKQAIATQRNTMYAADGAEANLLVDRTLQNRTLAYDIDVAKKIDALTLEQVNAAIRKWIKPDAAIWSLAGDFAKADCKPPMLCTPTGS